MSDHLPPKPGVTAVLPPDERPAYALGRRQGAPLPVAEERRAGMTRAEMAGIISARRFTLAFQPVVKLADRRPVYHEAFLRLAPLPGGAQLPGGVFAQAAYGWGLGPALDAAVLDAALSEWARAGSTPVSVNIAAASLCAPAFLFPAQARIGGEGAALLLEVRADTPPPDPAAFREGAQAMQDLGVRLCLDGLGAAEGALACANLTHWEQMKLDGGVLRAAAAGERGRRLLAALVALATSAGSGAVAKHIETLPQAWLAQEAGIRLGQGWLFGAPGKLGA